MQLAQELKRKRGRPADKTVIEINEEFCNDVAKLMSYGLSQAQVATFYGVTPATLTNYKNQYPTLFNALESGRIKGLVTSSEALMRNIERKGCVSSIRWYEATRHNFSEKIKTENETTVKVQSLEQYLREEKYVGPHPEIETKPEESLPLDVGRADAGDVRPAESAGDQTDTSKA